MASNYSLASVLASVFPSPKVDAKESDGTARPFGKKEAEASKDVVFVERETPNGDGRAVAEGKASIPQNLKDDIEARASEAKAYTNASVWIARGVGIGTVLFLAYIMYKAGSASPALAAGSASPKIEGGGMVRRVSSERSASTAHGLTTGFSGSRRRRPID